MWIAALAAVVAVGTVALETLRRANLYWYDVRQDYTYEFVEGASRSMPLALTAEAFTLPQWEGSWDTAIVRFEVAASPLGWWFDPCIDVTAEGEVQRQCFERGARGVRYLLLPPAYLRPGLRVDLSGHHLDWNPQTAELILFDAPDLRNGRILVLAPHPDDAEIAAFGLYSSHDSYLATITAGNYVDGLYSDLGLDLSDQDDLRGEVRTWDSLIVPLWGGLSADRVVSLGYQTNSLRYLREASRTGLPLPEELREIRELYRQGAVEEMLGGRNPSAEWESLVSDLEAIVTATQPIAVLTPHPVLDGNVDHQHTTLALLDALDNLGDAEITLLLYDNHHVLSEHYPFGPSNTWVTLPPWFEATGFAAVFSHPVDADTQLRKLFALEAMHDLRGPPIPLTGGGPAAVFADRVREAFEVVRRDPFGDYSYFRRAVRPNELFFVYGPDHRALLQDQVSSRVMQR